MNVVAGEVALPAETGRERRRKNPDDRDRINRARSLRSCAVCTNWEKTGSRNAQTAQENGKS